MRLLAALCLLVLLGLSACRPQPAPDADAPVVWLAQTYSGGQQCAPREPYSPPNVAELLARKGVEVVAAAAEPLSVCQACNCPAYAARHYVQVRAEDAATVEAMGFERAGPPPENARRSG